MASASMLLSQQTNKIVLQEVENMEQSVGCLDKVPKENGGLWSQYLAIRVKGSLLVEYFWENLRSTQRVDKRPKHINRKLALHLE
jgi:hypothetical protein